MKLQISGNVNAIEWDKNLCSLGGSIFHSSIWAKYTLACFPNIVPHFFTLLSDDGELLGVALGFQKSSRYGLKGYFDKSLSLDAMPVVRNGNSIILYELLLLLEGHSYDSNYITISIGSFASKEYLSELEKLNFSLSKRLEFELRIDCSEGDLWKKIGDKKRNKIRKAQKIGVTVDILQGETGIKKLYELHNESMQRIGDRAGNEVGPNLNFREEPIKILLDSGFASIAGATLNGRVVSAALFTCFNGLVYYTLSGSSQIGFETQAPSLLLWETIRRYQAEGAKKFNLGGCAATAVDSVSPEHGLYVFKKNFGGECLPCTSGEKVYHKTRQRIFSAVRSILRH